jgi:hypothetical protein
MMRVLKRLVSLFILASFVFLLFPRFVNAYIDPGTGSYVFQVILAAIVGSLFALKIYWRKIILFLKKLFAKGGN